MKFYEVVKQVLALLEAEGRVSYRALKREFDLNDDYLEDLKEEIIGAKRLAVEEEGRFLVWTGDGATTPQPQDTPRQPPSTYTPPHLAERIRAEQQAMESRGATDGERKTITALFADLKGSTALIEGLDPEDARAIIDPALQLMMDAVHRYDGYVAQALGDGIFALFGAPIAHEDHPQRALYAALRMQEEMRHYAEKLRAAGGAPLQMRVGINTGEVVVRSIRKDDLHTDYVPVGHSTNLAARMEQLANPGSIVVTEQTHKLTDGYFNFQALGKTKVKGAEEPIPIFEVTGAGPLRTRLQVSARRGLSRFVGRHAELDQMQQALAQAKEGHGQIVGVMGEPGLGKSRLFHEFKLMSQSGCLVLEAFAVSHGKASPYLPLIELLKNYFQIEPTDDERTRKEKVGGKVLMLDRSLEDILPYLFSLLGIADAQSSLQQMDAQIRRQRTFEALKHLFLRESLNQPLILVFEDLHWIDTETQGFLDTLSESVASAKLVLLVNYRPEYRHEWGTKTYYTQLHLAPLGKEEAEELLTFLLGPDVGATGRSPLQALKQLILEKTEGTPFFMEEVVQTLAEDGGLSGERGHYRLETTPSELHISPTVQGVLAARIDRLTAAEKELLQQLSVIGRQFPVSLVKAVVSQTEDELYPLLASLQAKEFLYEQPAFPESEYLFKHALTQDVAYGTVLQEQRKTLHERTGQAMEALYKDSLEDHCIGLAHHYSRSENTEKAVEYLSLADQQAMQHAAYAEAVNYLATAVELLRLLSDTRTHAQKELSLQIALGTLFTSTRGWGAAERETAYTRARVLCEQVGDAHQLYSVLFGLYITHAAARADYTRGQEFAEQLLAVADKVQDSFLLVDAHYNKGYLAYITGEFVQARRHFEAGLTQDDGRDPHPLPAQSLYAPGVACLSYVAATLWHQGYPEQAVQRSQEAIALAQALPHPFSLAWALQWAAHIRQYCRDVQPCQALAELTVALSHEHGFPSWLAAGMAVRGWAVAELGEREEGVAQIRQGVAAFLATGTQSGQTIFYNMLADSYRTVGHPKEGLVVIGDALAFAAKTAERVCEAELHRLKGELFLQQPQDQQSEAEASFHTALEVARHQEAKSLELRAATSLARLWQSQGKQAEARELLTPVYDWFTEGFDTADLKDAKALLDQLS